jgi:alpha-glucosidase
MGARPGQVCVLLLAAAAARAEVADTRWTVESPNGELAFTLRLDPGAPDTDLTYTVERGPAAARSTVLQRSPLGLRTSGGRFDHKLRFLSASSPLAIDETYALPHGKHLVNRHQAHQRTFMFVNTPESRGGGGGGEGGWGGRGPVETELELTVRVANDGVAFRYAIPATRTGNMVLNEELTGFKVPAGATAWIAPQQPPDRYSPAYEEFYQEVASGTTAPTPSGWSFPALFKIDGGRSWLLITESGVDENHCGSRLASEARDGLYRVRLPEVGEGMGVGNVEPQGKLPWTLPWRVLIVGGTLPKVVESTLVNDVAPPSAIGTPSWIKPGRASWSWWSDDDSPKDEAKLKDFIDLASEMGWEYSLVDANWNLMPEGTIERLVEYGRAKNVGLMLWYNSGGPHNDVTEAPRDLMYKKDVRRKELEKLQRWGVKGIKVDFWHSDKQDRIAQYIDILKDAADFQIMVNFHGCTIPRGWTRTYPNLIGMEAVLGAEQYKFRERYPELAPWHNTVLAFTRNVIGPMDYTPVTFMDKKYPRLTTNAHELALAVVFETPVLHLADSSKNYRALSEPAKEYLKAVRSVWDESRLLSGDPGRRAVFARRSGKDWFVGGINGQKTSDTYDLDLSFLGEGTYTLSLITDGKEPRTIESATRTVRSTDRPKIAMLPRGGFCARLTQTAAR